PASRRWRARARPRRAWRSSIRPRRFGEVWLDPRSVPSLLPQQRIICSTRLLLLRFVSARGGGLGGARSWADPRPRRRVSRRLRDLVRLALRESGELRGDSGFAELLGDRSARSHDDVVATLALHQVATH